MNAKKGIFLGEDRVDKAIKDFIVIPVIVLIGFYVTAAIIDSFLHLNSETFKIIFTGVGGVGFFIVYLKRKMSEL